MPDETSPLTVVYIEDNLENLHLVEWVLEATGGYRVLGATDGVAGLELVRRHSPALVLLDLDLALFDGLELARRIHSEFKSIPLVAVSASVMRGERQRSLDAGCMAFVEKPFDIVAFREVVADCIQRSKAVGSR